jgi:hypothetical protein
LTPPQGCTPHHGANSFGRAQKNRRARSPAVVSRSALIAI